MGNPGGGRAHLVTGARPPLGYATHISLMYDYKIITDKTQSAQLTN